MDLQGILSNLLGNKLSTVRTADGTTYGPAVSLVSRTPIEYGDLDSHTSGEFYPDKNSIKIDPKKGNVSAVTRHEQVHAILNSLPQAGAPQTTSAPGFMDIARRLQGQVAGNIEDEVPAYMAMNPTSQFYGVSDAQRNNYMQGLVNQLQKLDPTIAAKMQRLSGIRTR